MRLRRVRDERREWALATLEAHVELDGSCERCSSAFGSRAAWPCGPVRSAETYAGFTREDLRRRRKAAAMAAGPGRHKA